MIKFYFILFVRCLSKILFIFPIKKKRVLFYSFSGKQYSDSPKCISDKLLDERNYEIIWALNKPEEVKGVKTVKYGSIKHAFYSATAGIIVTNTGPWKAVSNRKGQHIINTWHGGGAYKKTGIDNPYKDKYRVLYNKRLGQKGVDLFLSSSDLFSQYAIRGAFEYEGKILTCGLPRNDILLDESRKDFIVSKVKKTYGINKNSKIVMYAPTWRNYAMDSFEKLDVNKLLLSITERFKGDWVFFIRNHSLSNELNVEANVKIIDATAYADMQELLISSDILISDYSSCIWDFSLMNKMCVLFTPDLDMYTKKFSFYTPIDKWGFYIANSNNELREIIKKIRIEDVNQRILDNHIFFGNTETGKATESVVKYIKEEWNEKNL